MIKLSHHPISMLYLIRGEYKQGVIPPLNSSFIENLIEDEVYYRRDDRTRFFLLLDYEL